MKGRYVVLIIIFSFFAASVGGIIFFSNNSSANNYKEIQRTTTTLRATVESAVIKSQFTSTDITSNDYIEEMTIAFNSKKQGQTFQLKSKIGQELYKGNVVYSYLKKNFHMSFNGRLVEHNINDNYARLIFLNFEKQYIESQVDVEKLTLLKAGDEVSLQVVYSDTAMSDCFKGTISLLGYTVNDNRKVPVRITTDRRLLPGTVIRTTYTVTKKAPSLYILKQLLQQDSDGKYYLEIEKSDYSREKREVEIGETFTSYNNNTQTEYIEILSGVSEKEKAIIDIIELDGENRREDNNG